MSAGWDAVLVAHVASAVIGFGAIGAAGYEARLGRSATDPAHDLSIRRFFRPGVDWPGHVIFLVPVLGLALLFGDTRSDASRSWPWIGLAVWLAAAGIATGRCWPAERRAQRALDDLVRASDAARLPAGAPAGAPVGAPAGAPAPEALASFRDACRQMETSAAVVSLLFLAAVAIMIVQP